MFCIECGTQLAEGCKFCPTCGKAVSGPAQPENAPVSTPVSAPVYAAPVYTYPVYMMPGMPSAPGSAPVSTGVSPAYRVRGSAGKTAPQPAFAYSAPIYAANAAAPGAGPAAGTAASVSASAGQVSAASENAEAAQEPVEPPTVAEPQLEDTTKPLTVWQTIVCLLALFCLPVGNIIFACVWGFRLEEHPQRRTLARAALPFIAVGLVVLFCALLWVTLNLNSISISIR